MTTRYRWVAFLLLLAVAACHRGPTQARTNPELLTQAEMRDHNFNNVYDAIAALRANWLTLRGTDSFLTPSEILVYFDQTRLGGISELRGITVNSIAWTRHYSGVDATTRWGIGHGAGVIFLSSRQ